MPESVGDLIEAVDMNGLLRVVDSYCGNRMWDELLDLADMCEEAVERGKQLWPIAAHIDYRLALEAPADIAADVLTSELGRFTLGPLTEVAASTHPWNDLIPHITEDHIAAFVAQERVLRGEVLAGDHRAHPEVMELPLELLDFEPTYALATYRSNLVEVSEPWDPVEPLAPLTRAPRPVVLDEPELETALLELVTPWTNESNGAARAVVVDGGVAAAVSALTFDAGRIGRLRPEEALQRMAWAAASGGAHGRRRGAARGRFLAWHAATTAADLAWPPDPGELAATLKELEWYRWDEGAPEQGWVLRIAVEDPEQGWSAAIAATDILEEEEDE